MPLAIGTNSLPPDLNLTGGKARVICRREEPQFETQNIWSFLSPQPRTMATTFKYTYVLNTAQYPAITGKPTWLGAEKNFEGKWLPLELEGTVVLPKRLAVPYRGEKIR